MEINGFPAKYRRLVIPLAVDVPAWDDRTPEDITAALLAALEVGSDDESVCDLKVSATVAYSTS